MSKASFASVNSTIAQAMTDVSAITSCQLSLI